MNRVDKLIEASRGYGRVWKEFVENYSKNPNILFCFFEGNEDPKYYGLRIDNYAFKNQIPSRQNLWCNGKGNLIEVFELVSSDPRFANAWIAFFMDRDFDDLSELPQSELVYITPCYAIENLYIGSFTFSHILHDEFGLSPSDKDFSSTLELFEQLLEQFNNESEELNAWIYLQRRYEKANPSNFKMNLQDISSDNLFDIKLSGINKKYTLSDLVSIFPHSRSIASHEISIQVNNFKILDRTETFRGKYLIFFLSKLIKLLVEDSNKRRNREHFSSRRKVTLQLSSNIISELTQYAQTPPCLLEFLHQLASRHTLQLNLDI